MRAISIITATSALFSLIAWISGADDITRYFVMMFSLGGGVSAWCIFDIVRCSFAMREEPPAKVTRPYRRSVCDDREAIDMYRIECPICGGRLG